MIYQPVELTLPPKQTKRCAYEVSADEVITKPIELALPAEPVLRQEVKQRPGVEASQSTRASTQVSQPAESYQNVEEDLKRPGVELEPPPVLKRLYHEEALESEDENLPSSVSVYLENMFAFE